MPTHQRRRRGFTLTEVLVSLAVLGIIGAILLPNFQTALQNNSRSSQNLVLSGSVSQARTVAARDGNGYAYPATLASDLAGVDDRHVTGAAGDGEISVHRVSGTTAVFATRSSTGACLVLVDRIDLETQSWGVDEQAASCDAGAAVGLVNSISGTAFEPTTIDL